MIVELLATVAGTSVIVGPSALYAGAKFREHIPIRVPTNKTRLDDAETDLRLMEISRERRQLDFNIERDELLARGELADKRVQLEERETRELERAEGKGHRILEARLLDSARRAFPDQPWGTVQNADRVLEIVEHESARLRHELDLVRAAETRLVDALHRARESGRLPRYLEDAAREADLLR